MTDASAAGLANMVAALAKGLVDHPDQVRVETDADGDSAVLFGKCRRVHCVRDRLVGVGLS